MLVNYRHTKLKVPTSILSAFVIEAANGHRPFGVNKEEWQEEKARFSWLSAMWLDSTGSSIVEPVTAIRALKDLKTTNQLALDFKQIN